MDPVLQCGSRMRRGRRLPVLRSPLRHPDLQVVRHYGDKDVPTRLPADRTDRRVWRGLLVRFVGPPYWRCRGLNHSGLSAGRQQQGPTTASGPLLSLFCSLNLDPGRRRRAPPAPRSGCACSCVPVRREPGPTTGHPRHPSSHEKAPEQEPPPRSLITPRATQISNLKSHPTFASGRAELARIR